MVVKATEMVATENEMVAKVTEITLKAIEMVATANMGLDLQMRWSQK